MYPELNPLPLGAYETPVTVDVDHRIEAMLASGTVGANIQSYATKDSETQDPRFIEAVTHLISGKVRAKLSSLRGTDERLALINSLIDALALDNENFHLKEEQLLHSLYTPASAKPPAIPRFPLTQANLLTNSESSGSMHAELQRELATADSVDLICAFVKHAGLRTLSKELKLIADRGVPFRVIASVYTGATEASAIRALAEKYGAQVKINYNIERTRLHAKAWLFRRKSGFDTAFVGSSNLSRSAMLDGLEWNVRTTQAATPLVVEKFAQTFDTYWQDPEYITYVPHSDSAFKNLRSALQRATFSQGSGQAPVAISDIDVSPRPHQAKALEALSSNRQERGQHRNLIIAATGTGKTITAALDYRNMVDSALRRPRLLFIAHTKEILKQSRAAYAQVLKDSSFGELMVGGEFPETGNHVFASIQTLSKGHYKKYAPTHFDVIVVDEFHHAAATSYRTVLEYFKPKELLGLTATPERADGTHVQNLYDLSVADELRLWDALKLDLLAPLHYYGINDGTTLTDIAWNKTSREYNETELANYYLSHPVRIDAILRELDNKVGELSALKGLGFCVNVSHAEFMAEEFNRRGIPSGIVYGETNVEDRQQAFADLRAGKINMLFGVNVFNEGLDIKSINTVLLLRPTQSPVLFLQQIGRGLRHEANKPACVVLDFIGMHRAEFNLSDRYAALVGKSGSALKRMLETEFEAAPAGTHIELDKLSTEQVLRNLRQLVRNRKTHIINEIKNYPTSKLREFLDLTDITVERIYSGIGDSFSNFRKLAGVVSESEQSPHDKLLLPRIATLLHVDDPLRRQNYLKLASPHGLREADMSATEVTFARMLIASIWTGKSSAVPNSIDEALAIIRSSPLFFEELQEVLTIAQEQSRFVHKPMSSDPGQVLFSHANYSAIELKAASSANKLSGLVAVPQSGILRSSDENSTLLYINLVKEKKDFSEQTRYADFPLSQDLFQWESPHHIKQSNPLGKRLIHHQENGHGIVLAMRVQKENSINRAQAYTLLGLADLVNYEGEKPITFQWNLHRPMPGALFQESKQAV